MNNSKVKIIVEKLLSKVLQIVGVIWAFLGLVAIIGGDSGMGIGYYIMCIIVFIVVGVFLFLVGRKKKIRIKTFQSYVQVITGDPTGSIENIAAALGTSQDVVKNNLNDLIKKKYFSNAYINNETNSIIIGNKSASDISTVASTSTGAAQANANIQYEAFTCKCCGGMNKIVKGSVGECDFCGSPLK